MRRISNRVFSITATLILALSIGALSGVPALAEDPDFTNIDDILLGQRRLLPVDDLAVSLGSGATGAVNNEVLQTEDSKIPSQDGYHIVGNAASFATRVGRMFNFRNDVILTITPGLVNIRNNVPGGLNTGSAAGSPDPPAHLALADFTGDGLVEMVVGYLDNATKGALGLQVGTAVDVSDQRAGLKWGGFFGIDGFLSSLTTGDLNGDGRPEIITASFNEARSAIEVAVYTVDPDTLGITFANSTSMSVDSAIDRADVVAGQFAPVPLNTLSSMKPPFVPPDQLALVIGNNPIVANPVTVSSDFRLSFKRGALISTLPQNTLAGAASGRLAWFGFLDPSGEVQQTEQLVVVTNASGTTLVNVFSFDSDLTVRVNGAGTGAVALDNVAKDVCSSGDGSAAVVRDIALGNFAQDLKPDGETFTQAPNMEIALLANEHCPGGSTQLGVVILKSEDAENGNFNATPVSTHRVVEDAPDRAAFAAGDTQGRSLLLGPPQIVRVNQHHQPDLILGAPPMHVDFITPAGTAAPTVFNMSAVPDGFNSAYDTMDKSNDQSSRKSTTSFSYSFKESTDDSVSYGVPDVASVTASLKFSAQQTHDRTVSRAFNTYTGRAFNASTATGFGDQIRFMGRRFNIYVYPVIGHEVCPNGQTCPPAQKHPLHVMFSGPDRISRTDINASTVEWYQPSHETGNVLSYPTTADQLNTARKLTDPNFDLAQSALGNSTFFTDSSTQMVSVAWSEGGSSDISVGSSTTFSFDESVSISASGTLTDFGVGLSGSASFSSNQSHALNTLRTTVETVGASSGVTVNKTGNFSVPGEYQYAVEAFIFGQPDAPGTFQTIKQMVDQHTTGPLEVGFTADPTDAGSGAWWLSSVPGSYTSAPDVALSHPVRWTFMQVGSQTPRPLNCILSSQDQMDCMTFNAPPDFNDQQTCPDQSCLWTSEFHWLRGLLITPADGDGGPQLSKATAGDSLRLQTRVYNLSLEEMSAGTQVHVRFYGQEWDQAANTPMGNSFLIEEVVEPPISRFGTEEINWILVQTTFDTTNFADKYLIFWVVVWMESNGELVPEVRDHGLTGRPGSLTSIADVPIQMHSNNVGFLKSAFYISPQNSMLQEATTEDPPDAGLLIETVTVSPAHAGLHEKVELAARLSTGASPADGVLVTFYDGDPLAGGQAFDIERIAHIRANDVYQVRVPFRPGTCGVHELFVVAGEGTIERVEGSTSLELPCDPLPVIDLKGKAGRIGPGRDNGRVKIKGTFAFGGMLDLSTARVTIKSLLNEAGYELVSGVTGMQLVPKQGARERKAVFESPRGEEPRVRVKLAVSGDMRLVAKVKRAAITEPAGCSGEPLTTEAALRLLVDDERNEPVLIETVQPWECKKRRDGTVKTLRLRGR